jgi:hypothetical protein
MADRGGGQGVVDVVEAADRQPHGGRSGRQLQRELAGFEADRAHRPCDDRGYRPGIAAVGAPPVAEMAEEHRVVAQPVAAPGAPLRVGGVLHRLAGDRRVLDAEAEPPRSGHADAGDQRVVGVVDDDHVPGEGGDQRSPAIADQLQLAVAVELVAEQVAEHQR